ncbi:hypothetical protein M427DRAFT_147465 [Gonapodya prolifera JEL478]|uniref:Auxin efflux carrier n=1 Tax=Gonapodya prolifera (strain JEL478) TaxID=1344416 RepID=A0A139A573_GONPJ|nr:hypothetical protein M427DRAFT_147465 [Gonapodya prolifera JEL478]|eukprot:KXS11956.1 hypothetical protein M427DRAFT_147465 [Gonapodya prolifera JEL478]
MTLAIGVIVWTALKPILRLLACLLLGFGLARSRKLTPTGCKQIAAVYINVLFPSLVFTKTLPSITGSNIRYLLPISVFVVIHIGLGLLIGYIIMRLFTRPTSRLRYTILAALAFANTGDVPNALSLAIGDQPPFNRGDGQLGVAYGSLYLLLFSMFIFTLGRRLVEMDWRDAEAEDASAVGAADQAVDKKDLEKQQTPSTAPMITRSPTTLSLPPPSITRARSLSLPRPRRTSINIIRPDAVDSVPAPMVVTEVGTALVDDTVQVEVVENIRGRSRLTTELYLFITRFFSPGVVAIILGIILSLTPLRGWFLYTQGCSTTGTPTSGSSVVDCGAEPPLNWLFGIMEFWAAAALPVGLVNLGAALGQVRLTPAATPPQRGGPKSLFPLFSIPTLPLSWSLLLSVVVARLLVMPAIGYPLVQLAGVIGAVPWEEKILRFILLVDSAVPTANLVVALTQLASPTGDASQIACVCLVQYAVCGITLTGWLVGGLYLVS